MKYSKTNKADQQLKALTRGVDLSKLGALRNNANPHCDWEHINTKEEESHENKAGQK